MDDGTHNETWLQGGTEYWEAIKGFMFQSSKQTSLASSAMNCSTESEDSSSYAHSLDMPSNSSIPIMPNNILSMTHESLRNTTYSKANTNSLSIAGVMLDKKEL